MSRIVSFRVEDDMYNFIHINSNGNISNYMRSLIVSQNQPCKPHPQHLCNIENIFNEVEHKGLVTPTIRREMNEIWHMLNS